MNVAVSSALVSNERAGGLNGRCRVPLLARPAAPHNFMLDAPTPPLSHTAGEGRTRRVGPESWPVRQEILLRVWKKLALD